MPVNLMKRGAAIRAAASDQSAQSCMLQAVEERMAREAQQGGEE